MKDTVFIQTNNRQKIGALVSQYSIRRNSAHNDKFAVVILQQEDYDFFKAYEGREYLRGGLKRRWLNDDLQSFTPLRFMPPEAMGYSGRAVVIDPDVFAVGDIYELLSRDMRGAAIMCRARSGPKELASSVMLLDCAKLPHWRVAEQFDQLFRFEKDYMDWISLKLEPRESIGIFENEWNDFDRLKDNTKLLHNTKRWTQPWKTGLPVDFVPAEKVGRFRPLGWYRVARRRVFGEYRFVGRYKRHWDRNQERFFFGLLRECLDKGVLSEALLREEMRQNHVRHDAFDVLQRTPALRAVA